MQQMQHNCKKLEYAGCRKHIYLTSKMESAEISSWWGRFWTCPTSQIVGIPNEGNSGWPSTGRIHVTPIHNCYHSFPAVKSAPVIHESNCYQSLCMQNIVCHTHLLLLSQPSWTPNVAIPICCGCSKWHVYMPGSDSHIQFVCDNQFRQI